MAATPCTRRGLLAVVGFGYDFEAVFAGEHGSEAFLTRAWSSAMRMRAAVASSSVSHFSLLPRTAPTARPDH